MGTSMVSGFDFPLNNPLTGGFRAFFLLNRGTSPGKIGKMWADLRGIDPVKVEISTTKIGEKTLEWIFARCKCRFKEQN